MGPTLSRICVFSFQYQGSRVLCAPFLLECLVMVSFTPGPALGTLLRPEPDVDLSLDV